MTVGEVKNSKFNFQRNIILITTLIFGNQFCSFQELLWLHFIVIIISVRVKVSNFISNIMIISLYVSTLQWCLHQEVHVTLDTDTTISNSQMKMQIFEMRMLWKTRSYYLPFLRAIFLI